MFRVNGNDFTHVRLKEDMESRQSLTDLFYKDQWYEVAEFDGTRVVIKGKYKGGTEPLSGINIKFFDTILIPERSTGKIVGTGPKSDTKDTNPKDAVATGRIPLHLIPDGALAWVAMAFHEGATKYDPFNWRTAGVRASTYVAGARRHISKWFNRVDYDEKSHVHHLANAIAGLMIVLDAEVQGLLTDDRPPKQDLEKLYKQLEEVQAHLTETFSKKE